MWRGPKLSFLAGEKDKLERKRKRSRRLPYIVIHSCKISGVKFQIEDTLSHPFDNHVHTICPAHQVCTYALSLHFRKFNPWFNPDIGSTFSLKDILELTLTIVVGILTAAPGFGAWYEFRRHRHSRSMPIYPSKSLASEPRSGISICS